MRAQDAVALWQALLGEEKPPTVFVGHSMGGAIATWAASRQVGSSLTLYIGSMLHRSLPHASRHPAHSRLRQDVCGMRIWFGMATGALPMALQASLSFQSPKHGYQSYDLGCHAIVVIEPSFRSSAHVYGCSC